MAAPLAGSPHVEELFSEHLIQARDLYQHYAVLHDAQVAAAITRAVRRDKIALATGMTPAKLDAILGRQLPDAEKRARADFVIDTSGSLDETRAQVDAILACLGLATGV